MIAAEKCAGSGAGHPVFCPLDCGFQSLIRHLETHLAVVDSQDLSSCVLVGIWDIEMEFKAAWTKQSGVEDFDEIGGTDDEDHFLTMEAIHLREELVDHRMFDAAAAVGAARRRKSLARRRR